MKLFGKKFSLVDGDKAFEKSLDWALELTSGNAALNGEDVPEDLREPFRQDHLHQVRQAPMQGKP